MQSVCACVRAPCRRRRHAVSLLLELLALISFSTRQQQRRQTSNMMIHTAPARPPERSTAQLVKPSLSIRTAHTVAAFVYSVCALRKISTACADDDDDERRSLLHSTVSIRCDRRRCRRPSVKLNQRAIKCHRASPQKCVRAHASHAA